MNKTNAIELTIPPKTRVRVTTTNGGEITGILAKDYIDTYGIELEGQPEISPWRISKVEVLEKCPLLR